MYIYIYMELLVKPEMLTSYIYGPPFGNAVTARQRKLNRKWKGIH